MSETLDWRDRLLQRLNHRLRPPRNATRDMEIAALYKHGVTGKEIAKMYTLSDARVRQIAREAYVQEHGEAPPPRPRPTAERNAEVYRRFKAGERKASLARAFRLSTTMITYIVRRKLRSEGIEGWRTA